MVKETKKAQEEVSKTKKNDKSSLETSINVFQDFPIKICVEHIENVEPMFTATDIYVIVQHGLTPIGQSGTEFVLDKKLVPLNYEVEFNCNIYVSKDLDALLTYPIYIMVWQELNKVEEQNLNLKEIEIDPTKDEILSTVETILGVKDAIVKVVEKRRSKSVKLTDNRKKTKEKNKSKESTITTTKTSMSSQSILEESLCVGSGTVDLLPFFKGETEIVETVPIYQNELFIDDRFKNAATCSQLKVKVCIQNPIFETINKKMMNLFQISLESMYNFPDDLNEGYEYKLATVYPLDTLTLEQFYFEKGAFKESTDPVGQIKFWPNLSNINDLGTQTKQIIDSDLTSIKNKSGINLNKVVGKSHSPKIVWNTMKRTWLTLDSNEYLRQLITRFRNWPIEIKITPNKKSPPSREINETKDKKGKDKKSEGGSLKGSSRKSKLFTGISEYNFMVFADISALLYPGVTKTRVVCEVRNFCAPIFEKETGYKLSCFSNYNQTVVTQITLDTEKEKEGKSSHKLDKDSKKSKDTKKEKKPKEKINAAALDAALNCEGEKIKNTNGHTCFIIIEAELMVPFMERRTIEDLTQELMTIIPKRPPLPKTIIPMRLATNMFKVTICEMTKEINKEFQLYTEEFELSPKEVTTPCFIKYLQNKGSYQKFLMSVGRAVAMLVKEKFKYTDEQQSEYMYDNYISMIYVFLINEMNKQMNSIMNCNITGCSTRKLVEQDYLYLCDEAIELDIPVLAEKYHLQVMKDNHRSAMHWFNLAVFYKYEKFFDRAFECCKEVLALQADHKYGLLLFGGMLYERQDYLLTETTLLALVNHHPDCLEAWVGLYIVYYYKTRFDGCDVCMENINKYKKGNDAQLTVETDSSKQSKENENASGEEDYFRDYEPLGWSTKIAAKTPFFQCAVVFIKLQILQFAEQSLLFDKVEQTGPHKYYLGIIKYFQKDYNEALKLLLEAQKIHGPDYAVNSMVGHCNYRLGKFDDAKEAYEFIVCAFNRPEDMHMLYTNLALIYEKEAHLEVARKYLLIVCKLSPTPYSWLLLGIVFFKEDKLKEAEACVTESNNLDNRLPENWAYLVLINIKLDRVWEARQCFSQMMKYELQDKSLLALVIIEMKAANANKE